MIGNVIAWVIRFVFTFILRILIGLLGIPLGVYYLLREYFSDFEAAGGFFFWIVFAGIVLFLYFILWKPILWLCGLTAATGEELF